MERYEVRIGHHVGLMKKGNIRAAYIVWKGDKLVRVRYSSDDRFDTIIYNDIACVLSEERESLTQLLELTHEHRVAYEFAVDALAAHGLGAMWDFQFDHRALNRGGLCSYRCKTVSVTLGYVERAGTEEVEDTILHEIAHALTPGSNHGGRWYKKALEIGCSGKRTHNIDMPTWIRWCPNWHMVKMLHSRSRGVTRCYQCGEDLIHEHYKEERFQELLAQKDANRLHALVT